MGVLAAKFDTSEGQLFRDFYGTSFACPFVSNLAARLSTANPEYSSNLVRALLVHSAELPKERPQYFAEKALHDSEVMQVYGYGKPDWQRASRSANNDVLLLRDESMELDTFKVFELPSPPAEFVAKKGSRGLAVTLAYDPPTRANRADQYTGVKMAFSLWKNVDLNSLKDAYRKWGQNETDELDEDASPPGLTELKNHCIELLPKANKRQTSTVQHAWKDMKQAGNLQPEGPLYLVVVCQRTWAAATILRQRFALILSLWHQDQAVDLHSKIQIQPKIQAELQLRAEQLRSQF